MEAGADMKYIQEPLGYGRISNTSDVYFHISKKIEKDRMNKFEEHMKMYLNKLFKTKSGNNRAILKSSKMKLEFLN